MKKSKSYKDITNDYIESAKEPFLLTDAFANIQAKLDKSLRYPIEKINDMFCNSDLLFYEYSDEDDDDSFIPRQLFFQDALFKIVPTSAEIEQGILYLGHRFYPFLPKDFFPSDVKVTFGKNMIPHRVVESKIKDLLIYHSLLGMAQFSQYIVMDNEENCNAATGDDLDNSVKLTVFDLSSVFKKTNFKQGDAFILTVKDWYNGKYEMNYSPLADCEHQFTKTKIWCEEFQACLSDVIDEFGPNTTAYDQLAWTFFYADESLLKNPVMHIGGFLSWSDEIAIKTVGMCAILWWSDQDPEDELDFGEAGFTTENTGCTDSLNSILEDTGISLCQTEIEAYMCDELFGGGNSFDAVFRRCFKSRVIEFYDNEQEKAFHRFIKDLWKSIKKTYNPFKDQKSGELRHHILKIIDKQLEWLRFLDKNKCLPEDLPAEEMISFAQASSMLTELLSALDDSCDWNDIQQFDDLVKNIKYIDDSVDMIIDQISKHI